MDRNRTAESQRYIAYLPNREGFGAQYQRMIYCFCVGSAMGVRPAYYSFPGNNEHSYQDRRMHETCDRIANFKKAIPDANSINSALLERITVSNMREKFDSFERNIDAHVASPCMDWIKQRFWENKDRNHFNNGKINVAVHLRRMNRGDGLNRTIDNSYYLRVMNRIRETNKGSPLLFHIYSQTGRQGGKDSFQDLVRDDVKLHIDEDMTSTFVGLVAADKLVTCPSSFSYAAALITDGEVHYKRFWHPPRSSWHVYE